MYAGTVGWAGGRAAGILLFLLERESEIAGREPATDFASFFRMATGDVAAPLSSLLTRSNNIAKMFTFRQVQHHIVVKRVK